MSLQSVPEELALRAVTAVNVMTVTWVTAPVPATQGLGVWLVKSAAMDSMEPGVKVRHNDSFLFDATGVWMLTLCFLLACNCSEHGSCDSGHKGTGACFCDAGWTGDHCETQLGESPDSLYHHFLRRVGGVMVI